MRNALEGGSLNTFGTNMDAILPPMTRFGGSNREQIKEEIVKKLKEFFDKYWDLNIYI